jgi:hypothetical protein
MSARTFKLVGAAGAAALAVGVMAGPASAAPVVVNYSCFNGALTIPITMDVGTLPAKMVAGQTVKKAISSGNVHLDATTVGVALQQGWDAVSGTNVATTTTPYKLTIPKTTLPSLGNSLDIPATGAFTIRPTKAGTYTVKAGDSTADIQGWNGATKANDIPLDCVAPTDGSNVFGTIAVSKDSTKTTVSAGYNAKKDIATGTAKVRSHFGLKATGKVKFTLKRGTHVLKTMKTSLNKKGVAKAAFKHVSKKGKYSITSKYLGNAALKTSAGRDAFRV